MMRLSPRLARMVATLHQYYTSDLISPILGEAETHARTRGGRQITRDDWDAVMEAAAPGDEEPLAGGQH